MNTAYPALQQSFAKMILSASGWRKVFAQSGSETDGSPELSAADCDSAFFAVLHTEHIRIKNALL